VSFANDVSESEVPLAGTGVKPQRLGEFQRGYLPVNIPSEE